MTIYPANVQVFISKPYWIGSASGRYSDDQWMDPGTSFDVEINVIDNHNIDFTVAGVTSRVTTDEAIPMMFSNLEILTYNQAPMVIPHPMDPVWPSLTITLDDLTVR